MRDMRERADDMQPAVYEGLYDWMQTIVLTFLAVLFVLTFIGRPMGVQQSSMKPTLLEGDRMLVRSLFYTPDYGDVIIFSKSSFQEGAALVKRIIALEGDVVDIDAAEGVVYVNGSPLDEPYTNEPTYERGNMTYPYTVPEGHIFVMGDNRNHSRDSRAADIGPVDTREVIGQVVAVVMPLSRFTLNL